MRILVIIHNQLNSGPYQKALEMCESLVNIGNEVTLACTSDRSRFRMRSNSRNGVEILEFPDLLFGRLRQGIDVWNTANRIVRLRKLRFDVVHAIDCRPVVIFPALWLKASRRVPLVLSWWDWFGRGGAARERSGALYSSTIGIVETFFEEHFRKYADKCTVVSSALKERLEKLPYPTERIELMRVGVKIPEFDSMPKSQMRQRLGLPCDRTIFCCVGTLFDKDRDLLIDSLRVLRGKTDQMPLTILVGDHSIEGSLSADLSIVTTGKLRSMQEVFSYLASADFGLLPLRCNPANLGRWPSKTSDYLAAGLPLVATPVSDYADLVSKHNIGYLSISDSVEDYCECMHVALRSGDEGRKQKSLAARRFAETELDWDRISRRLLQLYESIL